MANAAGSADGSLEGKVVLVAGASSGMGRATALAAAAAGARTAILGRRRDVLDALKKDIEAAGGRGLVVPADAANATVVTTAVERTVSAFGRLDILVNSVGTNIRERALNALTMEGWSETIESNLTAAFVLTQAALPVFRRQEDGLLIHISSRSAKAADLSGVAYQASKAGVMALAHGTMEEERDHGIRVTVVFPGLTDTPLLQKRPVPPTAEILARALRPEDVAEVCLFVMRLPARVHIPELLVYPSRLR